MATPIPTDEESWAYGAFILNHCFKDMNNPGNKKYTCPLYSFDAGGEKCDGLVIGLQQKRCKRERDT